MKTLIILSLSILFFACQGPQGPAGISGPQGSPGQTGADGATGTDSIFKCINGDIIYASTSLIEIESRTPIKFFHVVFLLPDSTDNWISKDCDVSVHTSTNIISMPTGPDTCLVYIYRLSGLAGVRVGKYKIPYMGDYVEWPGY